MSDKYPFIIYARWINDRFDELSWMVNETENLFKAEAQSVENTVSQLSQSEQSENIDGYIEDIIKFNDHYPNQFRKSMVVTWYSYFETELLRIRNILTKIRNYTAPEPKDCKLSEIEIAIDQIDSICATNLKGYSYWAAIDNARKLRNNIVHCDSRIKKPDKNIDLVKYLVKETCYFSLDERRRYIIKQGYIEYLCVTSKKFFRKVNRSIKEFLQSSIIESVEDN